MSKPKKLKLESLNDNPLFVEITKEELKRLKGGSNYHATATQIYSTGGQVADWGDEDA
ncbi:MAG: TIGR04149 family rSAM-modified RiPP [Sphingobacterium sp.]|nr:TIGR04149 family rSAM-modified RiPP [Sphingobacterium sp.]